MAGSVAEREAAVVTIGLHGDEFHLCIAETGGAVTAWKLTPERFESMMMRAHEASISYRVKALRAIAEQRLKERQAVVLRGVDYADSPDLDG